MGRTYEELRDRVIEDGKYVRNLICNNSIMQGLTILTGLIDSLENEIDMEKELVDDDQSTTNSVGK